MKQIKIIIEKHPEGYVGYPLGLKGVVVGEGNTYEEALSNAQSAIRSHIESFGLGDSSSAFGRLRMTRFGTVHRLQNYQW